MTSSDFSVEGPASVTEECPRCAGTGRMQSNLRGFEHCTVCDGTGKLAAAPSRDQVTMGALREAVQELFGTLHHANPTDDSQWHVAPGKHDAFSRAAWKVSAALSQSSSLVPTAEQGVVALEWQEEREHGSYASFEFGPETVYYCVDLVDEKLDIWTVETGVIGSEFGRTEIHKCIGREAAKVAAQADNTKRINSRLSALTPPIAGAGEEQVAQLNSRIGELESRQAGWAETRTAVANLKNKNGRLRAKLAEAREVVEPFAKLAEAMFRPLEDGTERNIEKHGAAWGYNEAEVTYDDFRRARSFHSPKEPGANDG